MNIMRSSLQRDIDTQEYDDLFLKPDHPVIDDTLSRSMKSVNEDDELDDSWVSIYTVRLSGDSSYIGGFLQTGSTTLVQLEHMLEVVLEVPTVSLQIGLLDRKTCHGQLRLLKPDGLIVRPGEYWVTTQQVHFYTFEGEIDQNHDESLPPLSSSFSDDSSSSIFAAADFGDSDSLHSSQEDYTPNTSQCGTPIIEISSPRALASPLQIPLINIQLLEDLADEMGFPWLVKEATTQPFLDSLTSKLNSLTVDAAVDYINFQTESHRRLFVQQLITFDPYDHYSPVSFSTWIDYIPTICWPGEVLLRDELEGLLQDHFCKASRKHFGVMDRSDFNSLKMRAPCIPMFSSDDYRVVTPTLEGKLSSSSSSSPPVTKMFSTTIATDELVKNCSQQQQQRKKRNSAEIELCYSLPCTKRKALIWKEVQVQVTYDHVIDSLDDSGTWSTVEF